MRVFKFIFITLIIGSIIFLAVGCGSGSAAATATTQTATVKSGNISITVTGTGNLALENKQELSFGQTGVASQASTSKISEVDAVAGQTVKQGQVLVKADTTDWQNQLTTDQHNLDSALANVAQAKASVAQSQETPIQDQASLVKAQQTLMAQEDVLDIQTQIDNANIQLQQAKLMQTSDSTESKYWREQIIYLSEDTNLNTAKPDGGQIGLLQKQMSDLLKDPAHAGATLVSNGAASVAQIQQDVLAVQQAQARIVTDQAGNITAQNSVITAQNKADDSQTALTNDKNSAQEIVAPFDGLITQVNVSQGQIVQRNATLIEIADPTKYQANIMVTETDSESIKVGDSATIAFDALTGLNFPGKITQIAPLATVSQGVVNYKVTVELTSLTPVFPSRTAQRPASSTSTGSTPSAQPTGTPSSSGTPSSGGFSGFPTGGSSSKGTSLSNITLRDGLSATVTIPIQEADNVLIVPARAITRQGQTQTVQVIKGTTTETITVTTGLTDGTNTAITSGLNAGDQVLLKTATSSSATSTSRPAGGGFGGGGLRLP